MFFNFNFNNNSNPTTSSNDPLEQDFFNRFQFSLEQEQIPDYMKKTSELFQQFTKENPFVGYPSLDAYLNTILKAVDEKLNSLIEQGDFEFEKTSSTKDAVLEKRVISNQTITPTPSAPKISEEFTSLFKKLKKDKYVEPWEKKNKEKDPWDL